MNETTAHGVQTSHRPAMRSLVAAASVVIIVAGLKAAEAVFVPSLLAVFLALLGQTPVAWLRQRRVPTLVAVTLVAAVTAGVAIGLGAALAASFRELVAELPTYRERLRGAELSIMARLEQVGVEVPGESLLASVEPSSVLELVRSALGGIAGLVSLAFLVTVIMSFVLLESTELRAKAMRLAAEGPDVERLRKACHQVRRYIGVKTLMCALTGIGVGVWLSALDVRFAILWGILAFFLNYIPVLGSTALAFPPVLLALADHGGVTALVVLAGYVVINVTISNFVEPLLLGRRLGLSPLVVFVSLVFWGWLWGPVGMLLAVPLTRIVKIVLDNTEGLRWIGTLMGRLADESPRCERRVGQLPGPRAERPVAVGQGGRT